MKKIIMTFLISILITSPVYAEEVIDVFEEYAKAEDFTVLTRPITLETAKNEYINIGFSAECDAPYKITITSQPKNGIVAEMGYNKYLFIPNRGFCGEDSFQYRISSRGVHSNISACSVTVGKSEDICFSNVGDIKHKANRMYLHI